MARAIWSGAISFGLVTVPVKLFTAVSSKTVRFHQLHATDHVRIQQKRWCPADDAEVAYEDIVKGYEIAPERYVVIEQGELDALERGRVTADPNLHDSSLSAWQRSGTRVLDRSSSRWREQRERRAQRHQRRFHG